MTEIIIWGQEVITPLDKKKIPMEELNHRDFDYIKEINKKDGFENLFF